MSSFFRKAILFIALAELISLFSFLSPQTGIISFLTLTILFLVICLNKLEWGFYILLVELFIGSKGYLFSFDYEGITISIRIAFFIIFLAVWLGSIVNREKHQSLITKIKQNKKLLTSYILLLTIIAWSFIFALIRHNSFDNIFFDFNAWLYFLLFIPFIDIIKSNNVIKRVITVLIASVTWTAIKTLTALYYFSHQNYFYVKPIYKWLRDTGVGEITVFPSGFSRIFFQSQIYVLIGFLIISAILAYKLIKKEKNSINYYLSTIIYLLLSATLITSLSRSLWVGLLPGVITLLIYLIIKQKAGTKNILKLTAGLIITIILSSALIYGIIKIPIPSTDVSMINLKERLNYTDPAGSSRINQLNPLLKQITRHPIIGSGFGTTVTYQSNDPRIKNELNPKGWYTTYAFEWGYLDILLKLGLVGLIAYLWFIISIIHLSWKSIINYQLSIIKDKALALGLTIGLIALLTTNIFSPYLNHPLGIGYLILIAAIFLSLKNQSTIRTNS